MATITWAAGSPGNATGVYGTPSNWVGGVVPGVDDTALFKNTNHTTVAVNANASVAGWSFTNFDYTANIATAVSLTIGSSGITGAGITIANSGTLLLNGTANFGLSTTNYSGSGSLLFQAQASAGDATIDSHGTLSFLGNSTADTAHIVNTGLVIFGGSSTAANSVVQNSNNTALVIFGDNASAGHATLGGNGTFSFNDASSAGDAGIDAGSSGGMSFHDTSTAGNAGFTGRDVTFYERSTGGTAYLWATGGIISFAGSSGPNNDHRLSVGALGGDSRVYLGANELTIGGNNLSASFSGVISDTLPSFSSPGSLVKIGTGTQALRGDSTYSGHTTIQQGTLQVDGSVATGVDVSGGTLIGTGSIAGVVTVAAAGTLDPGSPLGALIQSPLGTLTVGGLVMASGSTLTSLISIIPGFFNEVAVHGAVALQGATLNLQATLSSDPGNTRTRYTLIDNDGSDAINGRFAGLSEGKFIALGTRVVSISYRGGDGNDLVITTEGVVIDGTSGKDTIGGTNVTSWQEQPSSLSDIIHGLGGNDKLSGLGGNDIIFGGAGKDAINGGAGLDTADYSDRAKAVSVTLNRAHAVTVKVGGKAEDTLKNVESLTGSSKGDSFVGDGKANRFDGGGGVDHLTGHGGKDQFVFSAAVGKNNADVVTDFTHHADKLLLDYAIFNGIGTTLDKAEFYAHAGAQKAHDASDRIIYDKSTGHLYYDADGSNGPAAAVLFATLGNHPGYFNWSDVAII